MNLLPTKEELKSIGSKIDRDKEASKQIGERKRIERKLFKRKPAKKKTRNERKRVSKVYSKYITSIHWIKRRNKYWKAHKRKCKACSSVKYVQLHHNFYDRDLYGSEPDAHLTPLCKTCHELFHDRYRVKKNLKEETKLFVKERKAFTQNI